MKLTLTDIDLCVLTIDPSKILDKRGNPAPLDGAPSWESSDPAKVAIEPAADGMSATISAVGPLGTAQVIVSADARLGPDTKTITGTLDVEVTASEAATIEITPGEVTPQA